MADRPYEPAPWSPPPPAPPRTVPSHHRWLELVLVVGLAGVFLVNAAVALLSPSDFTDLIDNSTLSGPLHLAGSTWIAGAIFVHDAVVGIALLASIWLPRGVRLAVLAWAGLWLLAVAAVKVTALDAFQ
jgi:hypothetical protein